MTQVERILAKGLLALPEPVLVRIAGGERLVRAGRILDLRAQVLSQLAKRQPSLTAMTPAAARAAAARGFRLLDAPPRADVTVRPLTIPGPGGPIAARLYEPPSPNRRAPLLVWFHMGGGVIGDLDTSHTFCTTLAALGQVIVLSADYRLAPEHKCPAAIEDAAAVFAWARTEAWALGGSGVMAVGGDSMGGNLAALVCLDLKARREPQPALQLLIYPAVDWASETASLTVFGDVYPLTAGIMAWFRDQYLADAAQAYDPAVSPLRAADHAGLAPALIVTAGFDPLIDQGDAYAEALRRAGVAVTALTFPSLPHAFTAMSGLVPVAAGACADIARRIRTLLP